MHRQKTILSFFQKPPQADHDGGGRRLPTDFNKSTVPAVVDSSADVRGTDTPPEKVPRQILPANFKVNGETNGGDSSLFSSIMHKFVKVDSRQDVKQRYFQVICSCVLGFFNFLIF